MGIFNLISKKLARKPVIVETIKIVANKYLELRKQDPNIPREEIYNRIIDWRYEVLTSDELIGLDIDKKFHGVGHKTIPIPMMDDMIDTLKDVVSPGLELRIFVLSILVVETNVKNAGNKFIESTLMEIIDDELVKYNLEK